MDFSDPSNTDDIVEKISTLKSAGEVVDLLKDVFPNWIVAHIPRYSPAYPSLNANWETMCKYIGYGDPICILLVQDIAFDEKYRLVRIFGEILTKMGYSVRRDTEFTKCKKCECAIPNQFLYDQLVLKKLQVPLKWNGTVCCD